MHSEEAKKMSEQVRYTISNSVGPMIGDLRGHKALESDVNFIMQRIKLLEKIHLQRFDQLRNVIDHANELFDFFADIYINESVTRDCSKELEALRNYMAVMMRCSSIPTPMSMQIMHDDKLLGGAK